MKHQFAITTPDEKRALAERIAQAPWKGPFVVTAALGDERTLPQNSHLHPVMRKIAKHMMEHGAPKWKEERWRYYFVGKFLGQEMLADPDGSGAVIVLNKAAGTSSLSKTQASEMLDWLYAYGDEIGVVWD